MDYGGPPKMYKKEYDKKIKDLPKFRHGEEIPGHSAKVILYYGYDDEKELNKLKEQYDEVEVLNEHECICTEYKQLYAVFDKYDWFYGEPNMKDDIYVTAVYSSTFWREHLKKDEIKPAKI